MGLSLQPSTAASPRPLHLRLTAPPLRRCTDLAVVPGRGGEVLEYQPGRDRVHAALWGDDA